jgi:RNA polymerase sigma-B factor
LPADAKPSSESKKQQEAAAKARFARYRTSGDRNLRNSLIEEHRWVAVHCARRFNNRGEPLDDLIQVAQLGLLKAVERFDPEVGVSFASFAIPTVLGELRRHFRDKTWAVKVPRRVKDLHVELAPAIDQLSGELGRTPKPHELASHLGVDVDAVLEALDAGAAYRTAPLATPSGGDAGSESRTEDARLKVDDDELLGADNRLLIRNLLQRLPDRERKILELRFYQELSQSEIAAEVGVSQVHVSRLLRSSLALLQRELDSM